MSATRQVPLYPGSIWATLCAPLVSPTGDIHTNARDYSRRTKKWPHAAAERCGAGPQVTGSRGSCKSAATRLLRLVHRDLVEISWKGFDQWAGRTATPIETRQPRIIFRNTRAKNACISDEAASALGKLFTPTCLVKAHLLALDFARIARHQTGF